MLAPNPLTGQCARKQAHFKGEEQALLSGHCPLHLQLHRLCGNTRVGDGHGQNVITRASSRFRLWSRVTRPQ